MSIRLENISKHYGQQMVVNNLSLEIQDGEFFVLLGASGSGKTTVLNIIAGLISSEKGKVFLHGRDVTNLSTQKRNVGFVFQNYALFKYMTVSQNIEFGLKIRKVSPADCQKKIDELLEMVGLVGLGDRKPGQLSGGQQQRVALARALALEPEVLLLDEPLGALDAKIRVELRRSLKHIQRKSGVAAILVTHDQEEAFDLGDRIGVMNFGRLVEVGTPLDLYQYPKTEYVASFLGTANLLLGRVNDKEILIGNHSFPMPQEDFKAEMGDRAQILFRPEDVALAREPESLGCLPLGEGTIIDKKFVGPAEHLRVSLPAIEGVRSILPAAPYGSSGFVMDVNRSPEECMNLPFKPADKVHVGIRRLHVLSHPGLNFLLISDGSLRSQSAIAMGGYMARMSHAQVVLLGIGQDKEKLADHLQDARKQMGSGMASFQIQSSSVPFSDAVAKMVEKHFFDLAILGWRPTAGYKQPEMLLQTGDQHVFLATTPKAHLTRALICLASGEPGKDTVSFAGRLLRHMGAAATLLSVIPEKLNSSYSQKRIERFLADGQKSLTRFGIDSQTIIRKGDLLNAVQKERQSQAYDLIVLGAPLPNAQGMIGLAGPVGTVISSVEDTSFLIVQSRQYQRLKFQLRRGK